MEPNPSSRVEQNPMPGAKPLLPPALKSTEFWLTLLLFVALVAEVFAGLLPAATAGQLMLASAGLYKIARLILKWRAAGLQADVLLAQIDAETERGLVMGPDASGQARNSSTTTKEPLAQVSAGSASTPDHPGDVAPAGAPAVGQRPEPLEPEVFRHGGPLAPPVVALCAGLSLLLSGCAGMAGYERSYSLSVQDEYGRAASAAVTLRPRAAGKAVVPVERIELPREGLPRLTVPESWRRTLYHGDRVIEPLVQLNGRELR